MIEDKLKEIVLPKLQELNLFLVDLKLKPMNGKYKLVVLADGINNISIDQCAEISRFLGNEIEEQELIESAYTLEVSSPGMDAPFNVLEQYHKSVGRTVKIMDQEGKELTGELKSVDEKQIVLSTKKEDVTFGYEEIKKAKLVITF